MKSVERYTSSASFHLPTTLLKLGTAYLAGFTAFGGPGGACADSMASRALKGARSNPGRDRPLPLVAPGIVQIAQQKGLNIATGEHTQPIDPGESGTNPLALASDTRAQATLAQPQTQALAVQLAPETLDRTGWTVSADSSQGGRNGAGLAIDGLETSGWHTKYSPAPADPLPHTFVIDMKVALSVSGLTYLPRQDATSNGNIGQHRIETSTDNVVWTPQASGTFADDKALKQTRFTSVMARYLRITAQTEAGARGPWSSAAEFNVLGGSGPTTVTVSADSAEGSRPTAWANDGNSTTYWHTRYSGALPLPAHPHTFTIDLGGSFGVSSLTYVPRQDTSRNGNVGAHTIDISADNATWANVASGTFADDKRSKVVNFAPQTGRYVRLRALSEAGNRGPWTSAAEISATIATGAAPVGLGKWGVTINFPIVPVAAAMLYNSGKILTWSSFLPDDFDFGGKTGITVTATFDPATGTVSQRTVTNTGHDMFCPGLSMDVNGRVVVTGGDNDNKTSIYEPLTDTWLRGPPLALARGYQAQTTCSDGRTFQIGGSWSGGIGGKNGEVLPLAANAWQLLPQAPVAPMLTADSEGGFRADNHGWLFAWKQGWVFQAGPSKAMNWYSPAGTGASQPAGLRGTDVDSMNGNAVMYDAVQGLILTLGGAPDYSNSGAHATANIIKLGNPGTVPTVTASAPMAYARAFANGVVLPDGKVFVTGGQSYSMPFTDTTAILQPELWDGATRRFTKLVSMSIPRTYHSVALLMPDATVFTGGGGLCGGCTTNHFDGQVYSPPYLFNADNSPAARPAITQATPATVNLGGTLSVSTNVAVQKFAMVRMGSTTHTVDTDQRRVPLTFTGVYPNYQMVVPADPGVTLPGYWMLFALNAAGTPSKAATIKVTG